MRNSEAWPVGVADPFALGEQDGQMELLAMLAISRGGVATSGRDFRRWKQGNGWKHHIIDPRTGESSKTDVLSTTVVGPSALRAEAGAKAALILGSETGLAWLDSQPDLEGLLVLQDGAVMRSRHLERYLWA
jgi:thiamine biosynthesis lipoprotein